MKYIISILGLLLVSIFYCIIILDISIGYYNDSSIKFIDAIHYERMSAIIYKYDKIKYQYYKHTADSLALQRDSLMKKGENTLKLIPKFVKNL